MGDNFLLGAVLQFDANAAIASMGRASVAFARVQSGVEGVKKGAGQIKGSLLGLTLGFAPVTAAVGLSVRNAGQFNSALAEVSTIANEAQFPISRVQNLTLGLGQAFGTAPAAQAEALYSAIKTGATKATSASELLVASNKLAVADQVELGTATTALGTILKAYESQGLKAGDATDTLLEALHFGKASFEELTGSLGPVLPMASRLGVSFSDLNAVLAAVRMSGGDTGMAAMGLNAAFGKLLTPTKANREIAKQLGMDFSTTGIKAKGLTGFLQELMDKTGGDETVLAKLFGSMRSGRAIMAATSEGGKNLKAVMEAMANRAGATDEEFGKMSRTGAFLQKRIDAMEKSISTQFGMTVVDTMKEMKASFLGVLETTEAITRAVRTGNMTGLTENEVAIAQGVRAAIDGVKNGVKELSEWFSKTGNSFAEALGPKRMEMLAKFGTYLVLGIAILAPILGLLGAFAFILPTIMTVLAGIGSVFVGVFSAMLSPIGIVIGLVVLFRQQLADVFLGIWDMVGPTFAELKRIFSETFGELWQIFSNISATLNELFGSSMINWRAIGQVIGAVIGTALVDVAKLAAGIALFLADAIQGFINFGKWIGETFAKAFIFFMNMRAKIAGGIVSMMNFVGVKPGEGLVAASKETYAEPATNVERIVTRETKGKAEEKAGVARRETLLDSTLNEIKSAANNTADSAKAAADAAKKKPDVKLNLDGREVARSSTRASDDIQARTGEKITPWQRNRIVVAGARPV